MHSTRIRPIRKIGVTGFAAASLCIAALFGAIAPTAPADAIGPAVVLGPTTVLGNTAVVTGSVGATNVNADLTINGQKVLVDSTGHFAATLNIEGQSSLVLGLHNPVSGQDSTTTIPLNTNIIGPGGVISPSVLDSLENAAVSVLQPLGGTGGLPLTVSGNVGDPTELADLEVNGQDVLDALGSDKGFSITVPGTTKTITVTATDRQGITQVVTVPVAAAAPTGTTVAAAAAQGVTIAKVRYITKKVRSTKRMRMIVTVKDKRGLLIRGASVRVRSLYARRLAVNPRVKKTNKVGQIAFLLKTRKAALGKRLVMVTLAQTPSAKATKRTSVRLPKAKTKASAARRK
jgi:hypothetical protein